MIFAMLHDCAKFRGRMNSNLKGEDRSENTVHWLWASHHLELYGVGIFGYRIASGRGEWL